MISSSLLDLLLNKYSLGVFGALGALIYAYFKGKSIANKNNELAKAEAERALQARLRAAEAKNQFLEKKGEKINEKISDSSTIDELIGLFDKIQSGKDPSGPSDSDPK